MERRCVASLGWATMSNGDAHLGVRGAACSNTQNGERRGSVEAQAALREAQMEADHRKAATARVREPYGDQPSFRQRTALSPSHGHPRAAPVRTKANAAGTIFSPHFHLSKLELKAGMYQQLDLVSTLMVISRWRDAILSHSNDLSESVRKVLSGHDAGGGPSEEPHLAFLPLASVGHRRAHSHLLGMGLVLPADLPRDNHREALRAITAVREVKLGPFGVWNVEALSASHPSCDLKADSWTAHPRGATHWATVTPVVFDRHPKAKDKARHQRETTATVAAACARIGLPAPREVIVTPVSAHLGVPPAFAFPKLQRKDGSERRHTHAILVFGEAVCGPVLIGAGRFRGYGACRAMDSEIC